MTRTAEAQWFSTTAVPLVGGKALVKTQTRPDHALCLLAPRDFKRRFQLEPSQDVQQFFPSPQPSLNPCLHLPDGLPLSLPVSARLPHVPSENSTRLGHQHLLDKHVFCLAPGSLSSCVVPITAPIMRSRAGTPPEQELSFPDGVPRTSSIRVWYRQKDG